MLVDPPKKRVIRTTIIERVSEQAVPKLTHLENRVVGSLHHLVGLNLDEETRRSIIALLTEIIRCLEEPAHLSHQDDYIT